MLVGLEIGDILVLGQVEALDRKPSVTEPAPAHEVGQGDSLQMAESDAARERARGREGERERVKKRKREKGGGERE